MKDMCGDVGNLDREEVLGETRDSGESKEGRRKLSRIQTHFLLHIVEIVYCQGTPSSPGCQR